MDTVLRYFQLDRFVLSQGPQLLHLHDHFSKAVLPSMRGLHAGPMLVAEAVIAPHLPQVIFLSGFPSVAEMSRVNDALASDDAFRAAVRQWEDGNGPPFDRQHRSILSATSYSPEIQPAEPGTPSRIFELRCYQSPTYRQLEALSERFEGPEIRIFHRLGIHPILYAFTMAGPDMPNLIYLTPFENLAAREKAWEAFRTDPEWAELRQRSTREHGQVNRAMQVSIFRAAPYSPVR